MKYIWDFIPTKEKQDPYESVINNIQTVIQSELSLDKRVEQIIKIIRSINVFPIYYFNEEGIKKEIKAVAEKQVAMNKDGSFEIFSSQGLLLLDYLFPNLHRATSITGVKSMYDRFYDDKMLAICLKQAIINNPKINNMRTVFFKTARYIWNTPINFSPMRAKAIYETFCPEGGAIYDYSAGYGGRMLGALCSKNNYKYICTDPNTETYSNLYNLGQLINKTLNKKNNFEIYNLGSEDFQPSAIDFAFSCPPFFDVETYCEEETQSIKKFPEYKNWLNLYVRKTIQNCYKSLKPNGLFGVDLMNFWSRGKKFDIITDWQQIAKEEGFYLKGAFPIVTHARKKDNEDKEGIFIFSIDKKLTLYNYTKEENYNKFIEEKEKNKRRYNITVGVYDIFGDLINTFKSYKEAGCTSEDTKSKKLTNNQYYRVYHEDNKILQHIEVKKPVCLAEGIYYFSYADLARHLKVSRQAVSRAKMIKSNTVANIYIKWLT